MHRNQLSDSFHLALEFPAPAITSSFFFFHLMLLYREIYKDINDVSYKNNKSASFSVRG